MNLNFERQGRQILLEENEKLKTEIAEAENVQRRLFWHEEENGEYKIYVFCNSLRSG